MAENVVMNKPCANCQETSQADSSGWSGWQERKHVAAHLVQHGGVIDAQFNGGEDDLLTAITHARLLSCQQRGQTFEVVAQDCDGQTQIRGQFWRAV
jgi:hypothetical protein